MKSDKHRGSVCLVDTGHGKDLSKTVIHLNFDFFPFLLLFSNNISLIYNYFMIINSIRNKHFL